MHTQNDRLTAIRAAFPKEGLFAEKAWLLSPDAFPIEKRFVTELEQLGHRLFVFQRACNQLYQLSIKGKQPAWVARYLDAGKPKELIEFSRRKEIREDLPRVIRPDLILTEKGYIIAEIDSVPGGIGLTGWLNQTYSTFDNEIIGGADGMLDGFRTVLPNGGDIVISQEAATYRPEMEWIAARLNQTKLGNAPSRNPVIAAGADRGLNDKKSPAVVNDLGYSWQVVAAENYEPQNGRAVYRFFELFDLPNIPGIEDTLRANAEGRITITPPIKPYLEEKMWFALFWMQPLREFWRRELGEKYFSKLQEVIPYSWLLDPTRHCARRGPSARRMGKTNRACARDIRIIADDHATLSQRQLVWSSVLGSGFWPVKDNERACAFLSLLFRRSGSCETTWCARNDRASRQKVSTRHE